MSTEPHQTAEKGVGWIVFAGMLTFLVGVLDIIYGAAALNHSGVFVGHGGLIVWKLHQWGYFLIVLGAMQLLAALSIWEGGKFGQYVGIFFAAASVIVSMLTLAGYPAYSLTLIALDVAVIYGLSMYGGRGPDTLA
jgi:hypothetical protein